MAYAVYALNIARNAWGYWTDIGTNWNKKRKIWHSPLFTDSLLYVASNISKQEQLPVASCLDPGPIAGPLPPHRPKSNRHRTEKKSHFCRLVVGVGGGVRRRRWWFGVERDLGTPRW